MAIALAEAGIAFEREVAANVVYRGRQLGRGFRIDFVVDDKLGLELKSTVAPHPVHETQLLTYLRVGRWPLGYVLNFGTTPFYIKRRVYTSP